MINIKFFKNYTIFISCFVFYIFAVYYVFVLNQRNNKNKMQSLTKILHTAAFFNTLSVFAIAELERNSQQLKSMFCLGGQFFITTAFNHIQNVNIPAIVFTMAAWFGGVPINTGIAFFTGFTYAYLIDPKHAIALGTAVAREIAAYNRAISEDEIKECFTRYNSQNNHDKVSLQQCIWKYLSMPEEAAAALDQTDFNNLELLQQP